jgi:hypothetical protein
MDNVMTTPIQASGQRYLDHRPSASGLNSRYDSFLFAPICDEPNGMRLSVLSALARLNLDPWEEATHLAAMPKADARRAMVATLDQTSRRSWAPSEAEDTAARLVRLLPEHGDGVTSPAREIAGVRAQRLMWLFFAMAISFLSPHPHATTTHIDSASTSAVASPIKNNSATTQP